MSLGTGSYCNTPGLSDNVTVGNYSSIAEGCRFHCGDNHLCVEDRRVVFSTNWEQTHHREPITIGNDVWIGEGVRILQGSTIGDGAIIGAGAVVAGYIPPYAIAVGNPARVKKFRFGPKIVQKLLEIKWWDWPEEKINSAKQDLKDIEQFLKKYG